MSNEEEKQLVRIAEMYYLENKTQSQISKELNIHRSTISRLLKLSRERGIVNISIDRFAAGTYSYEEALLGKYKNLIAAKVVPTMGSVNDKRILESLGQAANDCLKDYIEDDMILGFSWGSAMSYFAKSVKGIEKNNLLCVPMVGGPSGRSDSAYHVNTITFEVATKLHGKALLIDAPAIPETLDLKKALMKNEFNQSLVKYWRKLDIAIMGIGSPTMKTSDRWNDFYGHDVFEWVKENEVAGDIVSRFYDENGKQIESELDNRLISIDLKDLVRAKYKVGIAESRNKVKAIKGALRGGYINILITSQETAQALLEEESRW